jgi:hypothetical protein
MPIVDTDIVYRLSTGSTGTGNGDTQTSSPAASLGKKLSTTVVNLGTPLNNIFDDVTGDESAAGDIEYRCIFVLNNHQSLTLQATKLWIAAEVAGGAAAAIGLDPIGNVARNLAGDQAATIANEGAVPAGITFTTPTTKAGGLDIGNLAPNQVRGIWIRRSVAASTGAMSNDGVTLRVEGDTAA